jgi:hypothetical protein
MKTRVPLLAAMVLLALVLFAPMAIAQDDDDYDDDDGAATSTATATATATSTATVGADDDDDNAAALPRTGGPTLIAPLAGALLLCSGIVAGIVGLRRNS